MNAIVRFTVFVCACRRDVVVCAQVKRSKELVAQNVCLATNATSSPPAGAGSNAGAVAGAGANSGPAANGAARPLVHGFIAALKDGFGFIETADHTKEVFFHFR